MTVNTRWLFQLSTFLILIGWTEAGLADQEQLRKRVGGVHVPFIANHGQTSSAVAYYAPTFAGTVYVTKKGEIVYSLPAPPKDARDSYRLGKAARAGWTLTEIPVRGRVRLAAERPAEAQVNYFIGNDPGRWRSGIPTYEGVGFGEVWPGVSLSLRAYGDNVEKLFTVRPGAQPSRIRMRIAGAKSLRVNEAGALVAWTDLGEVTFTPPVAYQEQDGLRRAVTVAYRARGREYGFSLGRHDPALPVVIDPLLQATYLGGGGDDYGLALAIHPTSGDVYVTGLTGSADFPGTAGGAQPASGGGVQDVFVARLNATLTTLIQATYLGGSGDDYGYALAIHPTSGEVFVAGTTSSTDFPGTTGGAQPANGGGVGSDGFVARLNAALTTLSQATYLGGSGSEFSRALAIHPTSGEVFVTGFTHSTNFPSTAGGAQPANGGGGDAFVARINGALTTLLQATYLGGSVIDPGFNDNEEFGVALSIQPTSGEVYVAGRTNSPDFPGTTGGAQPFYDGIGRTSFVARLDTTLTTLSQATYLGGTGDKGAGNALAIHPTSGEVFVAGETASMDFPGTAGGAQPVKGGGFRDGYVARLNAALTTLNQATYLGGSWGGNIDESGDDVALALAIHPTSGEVFVAGRTVSTDFPGTAGGAQPAFGGGGPAFFGGSDAFVARLNPTLTTLSQATYLGGFGEDWGHALAIHPTSGEVFVTGYTSSTDFPGTAGGAQPVGGGDGYVARLTADLEAILAPAALVVDPTATAESDGNGVFEPGETVPVIPSWENLSDSSQTPNGQASQFTGPAGATYTILSDTVSYPTLPPGGVGIPGGAYSMSISFPDTRPATHWEAQFTETLDVQYVLPYRHILHVGDSFPDVPRSHTFYAFIENVLHHGITAGCGTGNYCPDSSVTRAQMAVFLLKGKHGSGYGYVLPACTGIFGDVACPGTFTDWIEQLFNEGITGGCGGGNYCPDNAVRRDQMAAFLLKAEHGSSYAPPPCAGIFGDVTCPSLFADWIEQLFNEGITGGCGGGNYCPNNPNTRGQMAVFLVKTFELHLYGP